MVLPLEVKLPQAKGICYYSCELVSEQQTSWAVASSGETLEEHTEMAIQPSKGLTLQDAEPWQSTHLLGQAIKQVTTASPVSRTEELDSTFQRVEQQHFYGHL